MRTPNTHATYFVMAVITLIVTACNNNDTVTTTLGADVTVTLEDSVYFQGNSIGVITNITHSDLGTQLQISLNDDAILQLSSDAVVIENSFKPNTQIEIHNGIANSGSPPIGSDIKGIHNMVQFGVWRLGNAARIGGFSLDKYVRQFTEYVNSDNFNDQQVDINETIQQSTELGKQALNQFGNEAGKGIQQLQEMEADLVLAGEQIGSKLETITKELEKSGEEIFQAFEKLIEQLTE